jgi:hypothetical protein
VAQTTKKMTRKENQELQEQVKRAYQKLNVLKVRNDYLEHELRELLGENDPAPLVDEDDEDDDEGETVIVSGKWESF